MTEPRQDIPTINIYQKQKVRFVVSEGEIQFLVEIDPKKESDNSSTQFQKSTISGNSKQPYRELQRYERPVPVPSLYFNLQDECVLVTLLDQDLFLLRQIWQDSVEDNNLRRKFDKSRTKEEIARELVSYHKYLSKTGLDGFLGLLKRKYVEVAQEILRKHRSDVDVLVITAASGEQEALLEYFDSDTTESTQKFGQEWQRKKQSNLEYYQRELTCKDGKKIKVASVELLDHGETQASATVSSFASLLNPQCIAIVGICAGYEAEVSLGDIIIAERLFRVKSGKDIITYKLDSAWYQLAKSYEKKIRNIDWEKIREKRPRSFEYQSHWLLHMLDKYKTFKNFPSKAKRLKKEECPNFTDIVPFLEEEGLLQWISDGNFELTQTGYEQVQKEKTLEVDLKEPEIPRIWFRPVATGSDLLEEEGGFQRIRREHSQRYTCAYDMEGYSVAEAAWISGISKTLFVKAVSDYGDTKRGRNSHFRKYSCKVAANFLINFLKEHY